MHKNVGQIDRVLRILLGLALIAGAATEQIGAWGYLGVVLIATGVVSICAIYALLGMSTCPIKTEAQNEI